MNNEFESSGGEQDIAQGEHTIGRQINSYGIPPELFSEYAKKLAVTEYALHSFFKILGENQVDPGGIDIKLREIATRHKELLSRFQEVEKKVNKEDKGELTIKTTWEDISLSLKYIDHLKKSSKKTKIIVLFSVFLFLSISFLLQYRISSTPSFILFCFVGLLIAKEHVSEYRIRKGLFGTNRTEARELIDFIIKNSDSLDFTDSNGNVRRALLPEAKDAAEEHIPGTLGEEARA